MVETFTVIVLGYAIILSVAYVRQLDYIVKNYDVMGEIAKLKARMDVEAAISSAHTDALAAIVTALKTDAAHKKAQDLETEG